MLCFLQLENYLFDDGHLLEFWGLVRIPTSAAFRSRQSLHYKVSIQHPGGNYFFFLPKRQLS